MEEAFTSENWLVRIYKVKRRYALLLNTTFLIIAYCRPNLDGVLAAQLQRISRKNVSSTSNDFAGFEENSKENVQKKAKVGASYVGCYSSENLFQNKVYGGGSIGANLNQAIQFAVSKSKQYFAVASGGGLEGHAFVFEGFTKTTMSDSGDRPVGECNVGCQDDNTMPCGCSDHACGKHKLHGEEHNRRWSVYKLKL
jgi:hypothetical protein